MTSPSSKDKSWRCFHCDEVFTDRAAAREHFGPSELCSPGCHIGIAEYRRMEENHRRHCEEDTELHRALHAKEADHQVALRREEEMGYARGLRDAQHVETGDERARMAERLLRSAHRELSLSPDDKALAARIGEWLEGSVPETPVAQASKEQQFREALARIAAGFYTEQGAERHAKDIIRIIDAEEKTIPRFRGKPCTCDNCLGSSVPCRVDAGERLGELWYCRKAAESSLKSTAEGQS